MTSTLRPDERASQHEIEKARGRDTDLKRGAQAISAIPVAAGIGGVSSKILPFLSQYITPDLAIKGISKVSPKVGDFLKRGMAQGLDVKEGLSFIKEQMQPKKEQDRQEPAKEQRNIIEQESPELHQFILDEVRKGRTPIEAAAIAQNDKRFSSSIQKLMKAHKTPWSSIIESIFGTGEQALSQQSGNSGQVQQPQQGNADQALLAALDKILKM